MDWVAPIAVAYTLKVLAIYRVETPVITYQAKRYHYPEGHNKNLRHRNLRSNTQTKWNLTYHLTFFILYDSKELWPRSFATLRNRWQPISVGGNNMAEMKAKHPHKEWVIVYKRHVFSNCISLFIMSNRNTKMPQLQYIMCSYMFMFMFEKYSDKT
jgi:hypothetical protein